MAATPKFPSQHTTRNLAINRFPNQTDEAPALHYAQVQPWNFRFSPNTEVPKAMNVSRAPSSDCDYVSVDQVTVIMDTNQIPSAEMNQGTCWSPTDNGVNTIDKASKGDSNNVDYVSIANPTITKKTTIAKNGASKNKMTNQEVQSGSLNPISNIQRVTVSDTRQIPPVKLDQAIFWPSSDNVVNNPDEVIDEDNYGIDYVSVANVTIMKKTGIQKAEASQYNERIPDIKSGHSNPFPNMSREVSVVIHSDNDNSMSNNFCSVVPTSENSWSQIRIQSDVASSVVPKEAPHHKRLKSNQIRSELQESESICVLDHQNESSTDDVILPTGLNDLDSNLNPQLHNRIPEEQGLDRVYPRELAFNIPPSYNSSVLSEPVITLQVDTSSSVI